MEEHHVMVDLNKIELRTLLYLSDKTTDRIQKRNQAQSMNGSATRIRKGAPRG